MSGERRAYIFAGLAALCWSSVAAAFKLTLARLDFLQMLLYSSLVSMAALFAIVAARGKLPQLVASTKSELLRSLFLGFLNPFLYYVVLFKAYSLLPAQVAQPLNYTWAIALVLLSALILGKKLSLASLASVVLCYMGVAVISIGGDFSSFELKSPLGAALALGSSFIWALYWIYNTKDGRDAEVKLALNFAFGVPFVFVAALFFSKPFDVNLAGLVGAGYIGIFEMGVTFVLWQKALSLANRPEKVSNVIYLSPFISLFFIAFILGEKIAPGTVIGLLLIIAGIFFAARFTGKNEKRIRF